MLCYDNGLFCLLHCLVHADTTYMTKDDALKKAENNWEISSLLQYT